MPRFLESISPTPFRSRLNELCQQKPSVAVLSYLLGPERLLEWAHSVGIQSDSKLRACVPPVAPRRLRTLTAADQEELFLWTGIVDVAQFLAIYERWGPKSRGRKRRVLDFGSGAGRMTRFFGLMEEVEAYGVDVNPRLVKWCQKNLKNVQTVLSGLGPPMPFEPAMFDLVCALSIFTHLSADRAGKWIKDIARVIVPGGVLILTTHGYPALETIRTSATHQKMFGLDENETLALTARLRTEHFVHLPYKRWVTRRLANSGSDYGNTFLDDAYAAAHWNNDSFQILEHVPGGLRDWQDIVVLQRR